MQSDMMQTLESAKKESLRSWGWLINKQELSEQAKHGLLALPSKEGKDPPILCWIHEEQADEKISGVTSKIKMGGFAAGGAQAPAAVKELTAGIVAGGWFYPLLSILNPGFLIRIRKAIP